MAFASLDTAEGGGLAGRGRRSAKKACKCSGLTKKAIFLRFLVAILVVVVLMREMGYVRKDVYCPVSGADYDDAKSVAVELTKENILRRLRRGGGGYGGDDHLTLGCSADHRALGDFLLAYLEKHGRMSVEAMPALGEHRILMFDAQPLDGLGNRLRGLASALLLALLTDRTLVVSWEPFSNADCFWEFLGPWACNHVHLPLARILASPFGEQWVYDGALADPRVHELCSWRGHDTTVRVVKLSDTWTDDVAALAAEDLAVRWQGVECVRMNGRHIVDPLLAANPHYRTLMQRLFPTPGLRSPPGQQQQQQQQQQHGLRVSSAKLVFARALSLRNAGDDLTAAAAPDGKPQGRGGECPGAARFSAHSLLSRLIFQPTAAMQRRIEQVVARSPGVLSRRQDDVAGNQPTDNTGRGGLSVGVHLRMTHASTVAVSHSKTLVECLAENVPPNSVVTVASDAYAALEQMTTSLRSDKVSLVFPSRILDDEEAGRDCAGCATSTRESCAGVESAVVDIELLSRVDVLLMPPMSTFSGSALCLSDADYVFAPDCAQSFPTCQNANEEHRWPCAEHRFCWSPHEYP